MLQWESFVYVYRYHLDPAYGFKRIITDQQLNYCEHRIQKQDFLQVSSAEAT